MLASLIAESPPDASSGWPAVVGIGISMVIAPIIGALITAKKSAPQAPPPQITVPGPGGSVTAHDARDMSHGTFEVVNDLSSVMGWLRDEVAALKAKVEASEALAEAQDRRINVLDGRLAEAICDLDIVYTWIEGGMPTPPGAPTRPHYVKRSGTNPTI